MKDKEVINKELRKILVYTSSALMIYHLSLVQCR
jgi:hypothetical protein